MNDVVLAIQMVNLRSELLLSYEQLSPHFPSRLESIADLAGSQCEE
jgi:hypothetical protein